MRIKNLRQRCKMERLGESSHRLVIIHLCDSGPNFIYTRTEVSRFNWSRMKALLLVPCGAHTCCGLPAKLGIIIFYNIVKVFEFSPKKGKKLFRGWKLWKRLRWRDPPSNQKQHIHTSRCLTMATRSISRPSSHYPHTLRRMNFLTVRLCMPIHKSCQHQQSHERPAV